MLTTVQEISLNYHIRCEQYARFATGAFFNFNGTAGVWRRECIVKSGGWNARTTVEDMDLSLRAYLQGWKFVFLQDVPVCLLSPFLLPPMLTPCGAVPQRAAIFV
jgi:beta-mannan synthase